MGTTGNLISAVNQCIVKLSVCSVFIKVNRYSVELEAQVVLVFTFLATSVLCYVQKNENNKARFKKRKKETSY